MGQKMMSFGGGLTQACDSAGFNKLSWLVCQRPANSPEFLEMSGTIFIEFEDDMGR